MLNDLYQTEPYFARLDDLYVSGRLETGRARSRYWKKHPWERIKNEGMFLAQAIGLFARLVTTIPEARLRREYRRRILRFARKSRDPGTILLYTVHAAMHYHAYTMATSMSSGRAALVNSYFDRPLDQRLMAALKSAMVRPPSGRVTGP